MSPRTAPHRGLLRCRAPLFCPVGRPLLCVSGLLITLTGCTYGGEDEPGLANDSPRQSFALVATEPRAGATGVAPRTSISLRFDNPPDIATVTPSRVRVFSGRVEFLGSLEVHLVDQWIRFVPAVPLRSRLRYQVFIGPDLRGLNGAAFGAWAMFNFTTGREQAAPAQPAPDAVSFSQVHSEILSPGCASCHAPPDPIAGVDLSSPEGAIATLRGVRSRFGQMLRIVPGRHAESYLMLKLLGQGRIAGFPMPPRGRPLNRNQLRQVAAWIDAGARP